MSRSLKTKQSAYPILDLLKTESGADTGVATMESKGLSKKEQAWRKRRRAESLRMSLPEFWQQAQKKDYRLTMAEWEHAVRERRKVQ